MGNSRRRKSRGWYYYRVFSLRLAIFTFYLIGGGGGSPYKTFGEIPFGMREDVLRGQSSSGILWVLCVVPQLGTQKKIKEKE